MSELTQCPSCGSANAQVVGEFLTCSCCGEIMRCSEAELRLQIAALRKQLADVQSDAEVGRAIRELPSDYTITNDGLVKWEITRWSGSFQHQHYEGDTVLECLLAAGLLPKEAAR